MVGDFGWEHEGTKSGVDTVKPWESQKYGFRGYKSVELVKAWWYITVSQQRVSRWRCSPQRKQRHLPAESFKQIIN